MTDRCVHLTVSAIWLLAICLKTDALIGLRYFHPRQKPTPAPPKTVSPAPTQLDKPSVEALETKNVSANVEHRRVHINKNVVKACQPGKLLHCSKDLLMKTRQNNTSVCETTKEFATCVMHGYGRKHREEFLTALPGLESFSNSLHETYACPLWKTNSRFRHPPSRDHHSDCCEDKIVHCTAVIFQNMVSATGDKCHFLNEFRHCVTGCLQFALTKSNIVHISSLTRKCYDEERSHKV